MDRPSSSNLDPPSFAAVVRMLAGARLQHFEASRGERLAEAGAHQENLFLVTEGLVAILARAPDGATSEAGLVGPGGLVGHAAALGAATSSVDAVALAATRGLRVKAAAVAVLAEERPRIRRALTAYALARMAEVERLCVCAAVHSIEQRLARWLASAGLLSGDQPISITHEQLSELLGVRRASVTTSLHLLEGDQAVRCRRGRIEIRDMARLHAASCGCQLGAPAQDKVRRTSRK